MPSNANFQKARPAHRKACSRCRKRKIKCDGKLPVCSPCQRTGTACMAYNSIRNDVPRSVVTHLEDEVASLEQELLHLQAANAPPSSASLSTQKLINQSRSVRSAIAAAVADPVIPRQLGKPHLASSLRRSFQIHASSLPRPFPPENLNTSGTASSPNPISLAEIPRAAADLMLRNYTEIHLPQYPTVYEPDLLESYKLCFDDPEKASPLDQFTVCMALAISANTLMWRHEENALSASSGFWAKAQEQLGSAELYDSGPHQLQSALLLAHYALTNPSAVDVWYCVGEALRICIQLGYQKEICPNSSLNALQLDTRRRLFWTTYGMEK